MNKYLLFTLLLTTNMSQADSSITIYSGKHQGHLSPNQLQNAHNIPGYAVVKQSKAMAFEPGQFTLEFNDVAEHIDPTTVTFATPNNPDAAVILDQNFQFDLVGTDKLLQKYIDQVIHVNHNEGNQSIETKGKLLSTQGALTLQTNNGTIISIKQWNHIKFPELPGGLLTRPTLVWLLDSNSSQTEAVSLSYQTKGMTWWADYNLTIHDDNQKCSMDLSSWVSIVNKTGANFNDTQLKLIAGDVNRVQEHAQPRQYARNMTLEAASQDFTEQSLFEYHLYKLPRRIDLPNNSTKQIQLLNQTTDIKCERQLIFNGSGQTQINYHRPITDAAYMSQNDAKVSAKLLFKNSKDNQLGLALPAGRVRVNMLDSEDGDLEFIGEDSINHTPKNESITLTLGNSFDVTATRKQTLIEKTVTGIIEHFEISLNNQKNQSQQIHVIEPLYRWSNWQVTHHNEPYNKINASTIEFDVDLPAETTKTIKYTVHYQWNKSDF